MKKFRQTNMAVLHEDSIQLGSNYNTQVRVSVLEDQNSPMVNVELGINTALDADSTNIFTLWGISKNDLATIGQMLIKASEYCEDSD